MTEDINSDFCMEKMDPEKLKAAISHVWIFLKDFIPLANTHGADFLSCRHWEMFLSPSVQRSLLLMCDEELVNLPLRKIKMKGDGNCYVSCDFSTREAPPLDNVRNDSLNKFLPNTDVPKVDAFVAESSLVVRNGDISKEELNSVVSKAFECHLQNLPILTSYAKAMGVGGQSKTAISEAMSEKKRHEVQLMSNAVSAIVSACEADLVVDVGSGKGYLSMELSDHHGIGVLGLDSCASNTQGAKIRKEKLTPRWSGLVAREERGVEKKRKAKSSSPIQEVDDLQLQVSSKSQSMGATESDSRTPDASSLYVPVTMFVHPLMDLRHILSEHAAHLPCGRKEAEGGARLVVAGLHTCGSLAVSAMRLFVKDPGAAGLCCVGCCYQLMEEDESGNCERDFPLSRFGKSLGLHLGRNARNLASQSVHRLQTSKQLQGKDFYWRALLDVLLRKMSLPIPERIIGMRKLNKRCKTFHEYAVKAFEKLGFASSMITEEMAKSLEDTYQQEQRKMAAFFQYKLLLAPVIESLILLDRLLFLAEQDCVGQAFLMQLFDSVTSPRCYALVAYKTDAWSNTGTHSAPS